MGQHDAAAALGVGSSVGKWRNTVYQTQEHFVSAGLSMLHRENCVGRIVLSGAANLANMRLRKKARECVKG